MFNISALTDVPMTGPRSILRLVQVFARLGNHPEGQTLAQLCQGLAVPKTTLFTMLKVLESAHYLTNDGGAYRLGPEAVALGATMAESPRRNFPDCARGVLQNLCERTGETGFLAVLTPDRLFCKYVAVVETDNWLRFSVKLGSQKPAYATGSGRAMLAYLPEKEVGQLMPHFSFERLTTKTVSSRRTLLTSLKDVKKQGISVVDSGTVAGVTAVAAPIFGSNGEVAAAVTVGGPTARLEDRLPTVEAAVLNAAEDISRILGYRGEWPHPPR
ncbi:IclR family transcriptional regulator [Polaromonas sp.]|uniref:IclR family transcriptional regulator n=1 Tax=Polaromonas sp. TaxID=1869339 RepID=UPI003BAC1814